MVITRKCLPNKDVFDSKALWEQSVELDELPNCESLHATTKKMQELKTDLEEKDVSNFKVKPKYTILAIQERLDRTKGILYRQFSLKLL